MATITRGAHDEMVNTLSAALADYEVAHPGAKATLYRQSPGSIRIRIVDKGFANRSTGSRHDAVMRFLRGRLAEMADDLLQEVSVLLLLAPGETKSSFLNSEFEDPIPSKL